MASTDKTVREWLEEITSEVTRKQLTSGNTLHFVPINMKALEVSLGDAKLAFTKANEEELQAALAEAEKGKEDAGAGAGAFAQMGSTLSGITKITDLISFADLRNKLASFIQRTHPTSVIQSGGKFYNSKNEELTGANIIANTPATVYEGSKSSENVIGVLYPSYRSTQENLFKQFINKEISKFINTNIYKDPKYKGAFDVGHIIGNSVLGKTAVSERLTSVINRIQGILDTETQWSSQVQQLEQIQGKIRTILNELKEKSTYGPKIEATLTQDTRSALLSVGALIVIVQERRENQVEYGSLIEGAAGRKLTELLSLLGFSDSLAEIAEQRIYESLKDGIITTKGKLRQKKITTNPAKRSPASTTQARVKMNTSIKSKPLPALKAGLNDTTTSLQNLLNQKLVETVKQNMGSGNRRDILNLRTGRFAESVQAQRVSQSRRGMISVFYSYMRNPYATFSSGGQQERPTSRDPKLLISRSIRQIAAELMITNLRSINT